MVTVITASKPFGIDALLLLFFRKGDKSMFIHTKEKP